MTIVTFWGVGGAAAWLFPSPEGLVLSVVAVVPCGIFYWTVFRVVVREDPSVLSRRISGVVEYRRGNPTMWAVLARVLNPRWWHRVATATGWPPLAVDVTLIIALAWSLTALVRMFSTPMA